MSFKISNQVVALAVSLGIIVFLASVFFLFIDHDISVEETLNEIGGEDNNENTRTRSANFQPFDSRMETEAGNLDTSLSKNFLSYSNKELRDNLMDGGPPPDGIPSIDDPKYISAEEADLQLQEIVIGMEKDGEVKAYPQDILVHHEIVNEKIDGENVAITYCPLTATAQGFETGSTELGVSGQLLNSNLVMYDRDSGSIFPQIAATGIGGEKEGQSLKEFNLHWTTWENWKEKHPDTEVLSEETGHLRNYENDPYGDYNSRTGYYKEDGTLFPLMHSDNEQKDKEMVLGARNRNNSVYFLMDDLREQKVIKTENFVAFYEEEIDTGYIYRNNDGSYSYNNGNYFVDGEQVDPEDAPMEEYVSVKSFYFAWNAFYNAAETV